jgi:GT2 family glycosyltransferase
MRFSVLIPTYHNPDSLIRCLDGLEKQTRLPDEVVVLYEEGDEESARILQNYEGTMDVIPLRLPRMEHMSRTMNRGISKANGDIIAFLDEDVIPERVWMEKLSAEFKEEEVIACGGKDTIIVWGRRIPFPPVDEVGILKWKGYIVGNQHRGAERRDVMFLKGCNMAIRKENMRILDENLLGFVRWEQEIFFSLVGEGKRIIYDPSIQVFHVKSRLQYLSSKQTYWYGHNTVYHFCKYLKGLDRFLALTLFYAFGDPSSPGIIRAVQWMFTRNDQALCSFFTSLLGKGKGLATYIKGLFCSPSRGS